ncbi:GTP 3',8-cyclase MoaA [Desulfotruncus alcoholivorax]|uniref:GTP 3',8-cyclase MoaA n=1 Tax=Desulfotruncus alcoholivorax TaxID=265477 RepID=UPI00040FCBA6|nr:GTP 3',8-cyclase MoaA [Desulfotruncus alcoholivorax]
MQDQFRRPINYLRISVTDRCNLRCIYCMPPEGVKSIKHEEILSIEEIIKAVKAGVRIGIKKIRLTGGEPLVRGGIIDLVGSLNNIPEIDDIAITTNGILLGEMVGTLKRAGLNRVNISLDTMKPERFKRITRGGNLDLVWKGINAALNAELEPVKINTVAIRGFNDDELVDLARLTLDHPLHIRFIELMPIGSSQAWARGKFIASSEVKEKIEGALGNLIAEKTIHGNGPALYTRLPGARGTIGFISAVSNHFCAGCNRLRLTSTGQLRPCLFNHREIELKQALRSGAGLEELTEIFRKAIVSKPVGHDLDKAWQEDDRVMSQIGG